MIDKEKVLKGLECCSESISKACPMECPYRVECLMQDDKLHMYSVMHDALELLKKQPQWISVEDGLPDDASDVLAYYDDGTESRIIPANYYKRCWYDCVFNRPIDDQETGFIGYWMSLPEPPKEVKQE